MTYTVPLICSYCRAQYGTKPGFTQPYPSHGICAACAKRVEKEIEDAYGVESR